MSCHELCMYVKKKVDGSPRILNLLLDHTLGKPQEQVQQQGVYIISPKRDSQSQDAEVISEQRKCLPEGSEKEEGQELV